MENPLLIINTTKENNHIKNIILKYFPNALLEENPDIIISVGGDGTVLQSIKNEGWRKIPFFSIANGTLNFIPEEIDNLEDFLLKLKNKEVILEEQKTFYLKVTLKKADNSEVVFQCANDIVLGNGIMDYFHFVIKSEDPTFDFKKLSGGGLCVSTPLGSTAYHYNNNGTVIPLLELPLLGISSIVANRKDTINKPVSANQKIEIYLNPEKDNRTHCFVFLDGKTKIINLEKEEKIIVEKGEEINFCFKDKIKFDIKRLTL